MQNLHDMTDLAHRFDIRKRHVILSVNVPLHDKGCCENVLNIIYSSSTILVILDPL